MTATGKQQKQQRLLATALQLFSKNGLDNVSTAQIAQQAGVATGSLFFHFRCKNTLIHCLFDHVLQQLQRSLTTPPSSGCAREKFIDHFTRVVDYWLTHPVEFGFIRHYYFSTAALPQHKTALENSCTGRLLTCLSANPHHVHLPTALIQAILFGGMIFLGQNPYETSRSRRTMLRRLAEIYWTGFNQPAPA